MRRMSPDNDKSKATVEVPTQSGLQTRVVLRILMILLVVIGLLWVLYKLTAIILLVILSVFFAYLVAPLVDLVQRPVRIGGREVSIPRAIAIGIVYIGLFFAISFAIYFIVPRLADQFPQFRAQAGEYYKTITAGTERLNQYFKQHRMPESAVDTVNKAVLEVVSKGGEYAGAAVERMLGLLAYLPWLVLIPILSFFLLKDADSFRRSALQMLPRGRWRWRGDEFFQDVNSTLAAYTRAQLTACLFIGAVCAGAFAIIGLPSPLVLGLIAGLFEFVPLVGPLLIAVIAALIAVFHSGFTAALVVLLFLSVLRILQDYIVYPRLIGHGVHLHPLAIIVAILSGAELAGVAGVFLAIPIVAVVTVSYRHRL